MLDALCAKSLEIDLKVVHPDQMQVPYCTALQIKLAALLQASNQRQLF